MIYNLDDELHDYAEYSMGDFNRNGRLDIIVSHTAGSGQFTSNEIY